MNDKHSIAVVTDSTSDLPADIQQQFGITVVPLSVHFGNVAYRDQVDLTTDEFLDKLARTKALPTTSQPTPGSFEDAFRQLATTHSDIICLTISEKLSGTFGSAQLAADAVADTVHVEVIDSRSASYGLGFQVLRAAELVKSGQTAEAITRTLRTEVDSYELVFFVETLDHLRRGGRIGRAAQLLGSLLHLKPLLRIDEGQVVPFERTRTRSRALDALTKFVQELNGVEQLAVIFNTTPDDASACKTTLSSIVPGIDIPIVKFGPVITTHIGPGVVGVAVKERTVG